MGALFLLAVALVATAQLPGEPCVVGDSTCTCDPDTEVCCVSGEPQPCYPGDVTPNTVGICEVYQPDSLMSLSIGIVYYESTGKMWDFAQKCNNAWRPFRVLDPSTTVYTDNMDHASAGCLPNSRSNLAMFTPEVYGECYPGSSPWRKCPDYLVCFNGTCLTSCATDDDCYVFEPWNDVSCPYAVCNATGQCERKTGGTPGAGGSCPAEADKCTFNTDSGGGTGIDPKSNPLVDGAGHLETGLSLTLIVSTMALLLGRP